MCCGLLKRRIYGIGAHQRAPGSLFGLACCLHASCTMLHAARSLVMMLRRAPLFIPAHSVANLKIAEDAHGGFLPVATRFLTQQQQVPSIQGNGHGQKQGPGARGVQPKPGFIPPQKVAQVAGEVEQACRNARVPYFAGGQRVCASSLGDMCSHCCSIPNPLTCNSPSDCLSCPTHPEQQSNHQTNFNAPQPPAGATLESCRPFNPYQRQRGREEEEGGPPPKTSL